MAISRVGGLVIAVGVLLVLLVVAVVVAVLLLTPLSHEQARERLVAALAKRFDAQVELKDLRLQTLPRLRAEGWGLTIRHRGRTDVPPLVTIAHFSAEASVMTFVHRHISRVDIEGLDIEIPPDHNRDSSRDQGAPGAPATVGGNPNSVMRTLVIDDLHTADARLTIIPSEEGKDPRVWAIHDLHMSSLSTDRSMPFEAVLTNAIPPGEIETRGAFGPWRSDEPGETPLHGDFTFDHANLSVFSGISGILSARGQFGGKLERIDVHGVTDTPQFRVAKTGGHPIPLHTVYHAIVDGTNGNTILDEIDASFLNSMLVAKGAVIGKPHQHGRTVTLDLSIDHGRLEDILRLAVGGPKPPMSGAIRLKTTFVLPPGDVDVVKRLRLEGDFHLSGARFTNPDVRDKIIELSRRASGKVGDKAAEMDPARVSSRFDGQFKLGGGSLNIPDVTFDVPGAIVQLDGRYDLEPETLDFKGTLFMDVKVSETTTGFKRLLLKLVDPLFKRDGGGSAIPIRIAGTRNGPSFGLDKGRVFSHKHAPAAAN